MAERKHRSEAEWQLLIEQQSDSGQSALDFCREHGLYAETLLPAPQSAAEKRSDTGRETIYPDKTEIGSVDVDTTRSGIAVSGHPPALVGRHIGDLVGRTDEIAIMKMFVYPGAGLR
jgi:hypothetical protein